MTLIAMVTWDTKENRRAEVTPLALESVLKTEGLGRDDRIVVVDNGSTDLRTIRYLKQLEATGKIRLILNKENVGTARAVNQAWVLRRSGETCVKVDNDCKILDGDWLTACLDVFGRDPGIGMVALKPYHALDRPDHLKDQYRTTMEMLPNNGRLPHLVVEHARFLLGMCMVVSGLCVDHVGGFYQFGRYGYEDLLMCVRVQKIRLKTVYLPHIRAREAKVGGVEYAMWKERLARAHRARFMDEVAAIKNGRRPVYIALRG